MPNHVFWTVIRLKMVEDLLEKGMSYAQVAERLTALWGEELTVEAVRAAVKGAGRAAVKATKAKLTKVKVTSPVIESATISEAALLKDTIRRQGAELARLRGVALTEERVRRELLNIAAQPLRPPDWVTKPKLAPDGLYGTPVLFMSDQHLGEVVDPAQVRGVNEYNMTIAKRRWKRTIEKTIALTHNFLARPKFDGIVLAFGGDGVSGDIHDELSATNEVEIGPVIIELAELIVWTVKELQRVFGKVFIPAVIGNHPRMTHKPRAKGAAFTNFDWLAYQFAERELRGVPGVSWLIPSGSDAHFSVYGHRFVLTHGNQFRGGDGIIGPLGPVFRGDNKKRARDAQVDQAYDTLMVAHFHQLLMYRRIIMNGSLKGYDEWAASENYPFEPPAQALFVVHPQMGITFSMPVMVEDPPKPQRAPWIGTHEVPVEK